MKAKIALITILVDDVPAMVRFYREVLGFQVESDSGQYVEFASEGVRFSICHRSELVRATGHPSFNETRQGQSFELAFPCENAAEVDMSYANLIAQGASPIQGPATMPWGQRTAFFADPEGNIHEIFAFLNE